jgi:hypothetical protein
MYEAMKVIISILHDEHGIPVSKLEPSARIWHDLGVDGDDVAELLNSIHERFGTDFSTLSDQWFEFFNYEGYSPRSCLAGIVLLIPSVALAVWLADKFDFTQHGAGLLTVGVFFASWFALGRIFFPGKPKRPLTIAGLSTIVEQGQWPAQQDDVC